MKLDLQNLLRNFLGTDLKGQILQTFGRIYLQETVQFRSQNSNKGLLNSGKRLEPQ